jgi:hypothetical protein
LNLFILPTTAKADVAGLKPCKDSKEFQRRLDQSVKKLESRVKKYDAGSPPALALQKQIEKFERKQEIDVLYSNYFEIYKEVFVKKEKKLSNGYCQSDIIYSYINGSPLTAWLTLMIRKRAIDKLEYSFDKNLHISSDFDLIIRLSNFCNFDFIDDYLAFYRLHFFNESKNKNREIEELAYILMKYKDNKKINFLFNKNNFADKIFIKNFLLKENSNKFKMNYTQINNKFFMLLYFIISIIPKKILNIFYK